MTQNDEASKLSQRTAGDLVHTVVKAGLSAVPVLGGPAAEIFAYIIEAPISRRRDAWLQSLLDGIKQLEERVDRLSVESLAQNDAFITLLLDASRIAIRSHAKEKIEALRNAVLNAAIKLPDEYFQDLLLRFLDQATPWHLRVLAFYQHPKETIEQAGITPETGDYISHFVPKVFKELAGQTAFCSQIERDLLAHGLIVSEGAWYSDRTTESGDRVLQMISAPV